MQALNLDKRVKNFPPKEASENCASCNDDGFVVCQLRAEGNARVDDMAPCPFCMRGYRMEFPAPDPKTKAKRVGTWGPDGFWRGRELPDSVLVEHLRSQPLGRGENKRRMEELTKRIDVIRAGGDPGEPSWGWGDLPLEERSPFQP